MKPVAFALLMTAFAVPTTHADSTVIPLWPEGVPGAPRAEALGTRTSLGAEIRQAGGFTNVSVPTLTVFAQGVDKPNGTASEWPRRAEEWLRGRGLLDAARK